MVESALVQSLAQHGSAVRFDWGPTGAGLLARGDGALVIIDVLSFTTSVSVATGRDMSVIPYPLGGEGAADVARRFDAALAVRRAEANADHPWSLSPRALMDAPYAARLVLPSPNGSAIAASAGKNPGGENGPSEPVAVVAGCLRNAGATVEWLQAHAYGTDARPVWLIAAGERWPDGTLRPALEDELGAGAIAHGLAAAGCSLSPEAATAARAFAGTPDLHEAVAQCASGRELSAMGYPEEPAIAADLDADCHVSVVAAGMFVRA